jgi:two-component system, NarL family, response regulator DevR
MTSLARSEGNAVVESEPVRIVLVDDHELVRDGVRMLLERHPDLEVVGEAGSVAEAVRRVAFDEPDIVLLDVDLPDGSGVEACARMLEMSPAPKVLMLTAYADPGALASARSAGASGFVLKRVRDFDLVDTIRRVSQGEIAFEEAPPPVNQADPVLSRLTDRELTVLDRIAEGKTNREIAQELFLAEKTVKNYVSNLLAKMGMRHRSGAAAYVAQRRSAERRPYPPAEWTSR